MPETPSQSIESKARLTKREEAVLRLYLTEGEVNEGMIGDLWPLVKRPRLLINSLTAKNIVYLGPWWDEVGYELLLTPHGQDVAAALGQEGGQ